MDKKLMEIELMYFDERDSLGTQAVISDVFDDMVKEVNMEKELEVMCDIISSIIQDFTDKLDEKLGKLESEEA